MAREEHVPLVAMDDDGVYDVEGDKPGLPLAITGIGKTHVPTLLMPKILAEALDHGVFVTVPKIKAHRYSVTSMAIKGMQGTVMRSDARPAYKQKYRMHAELNAIIKAHKARRKALKSGDAGPPPDPAAERRAYVASLRAFGERMADVLEIETPDVVLADGAPATGGDGFWKLYPSAELVAIGGTNPVLVDRVGAQFLGLWKNAQLGRELLGFDTSPLITIAAKRFGLDLDKTKIVGNGAALLQQPRPTHYHSMGGFDVMSDNTPAWQPISLSLGAAAQKPSVHAVSLGTTRSTSTATARTRSGRARRWPSGTPTGPARPRRRARARASCGRRVRCTRSSSSTARGYSPTTRSPSTRSASGSTTRTASSCSWGTTPRTRSTTSRFELGPFGHFFDLDVHHHGKSLTSWSSGLTVRTTQDAAHHHAVIEARFTAPEILAALHGGARLPLGLYRMEGKKPRQYLAWSPTRTKKPDFHVPTAFGTLILD